MKDWKQTLLTTNRTIKDAIATLDEGKAYICLIVDQDQKLLGTITDGDVRRGILKGLSIDKPLTLVMNPSPLCAGIEDSKEKILSLMEVNLIQQIPIMNLQGQVCGLELLRELKNIQTRSNSVILMAGGLGSRLSPLTDTVPKSLLKVGQRPILEIIIENFVSYGFRNIYLSVNYKAEMIKSHFGDGKKWAANIQYINEKERMGTAGALGLLPEVPKDPVIVMNGDLLTKINFDHLIHFHHSQNAIGTMCVREYDIQIPYGVVSIEKDSILAIDEKPHRRFFVNAGIYVLNPEMLSIIPKETYFDMPSLFTAAIAKGFSTVAFPLREYWMDIGNKEDLSQAQCDFVNHFYSKES